VSLELAAHYRATLRERFESLKAQAERALAQVPDAAFEHRLDPESNSLSVLVRHVGGNLRSRFRDFRTSDGEKPDRHRDLEFEDAGGGRGGDMAVWEVGWGQLSDALEGLADADLTRSVAIRGEPHTVVEALERSLTHTSGHVGQIVLLAKHLAGEGWRTLSLPRRRQG
jgi:hypothetical protein